MERPNLSKIIKENLEKDKFQSKAQPSLPKGGWLDEFKSGGSTYISDTARATQFGQYSKGGSSWMLTNPNKISTFFPRMNDGGGLLSRTVTCSNCGHSWKGVTGGTDPLTCHDCGGMIKMKNGGDPSITNLDADRWLMKYQIQGQVINDQPVNQNINRTIIFAEDPSSDGKSPFLEEASSFKSYLNKSNPKENVEIYNLYKDPEKLKRILATSDQNTRIAMMAHHGQNTFGIPNEDIGKQLQNTKYGNCYMGECFSEDIAKSKEFKDLPNLYYRPEGKWWGANPAAKASKDESGVINSFFGRVSDFDTPGSPAKIIKPDYGHAYGVRNVSNVGNVPKLNYAPPTLTGNSFKYKLPATGVSAVPSKPTTVDKPWAPDQQYKAAITERHQQMAQTSANQRGAAARTATAGNTSHGGHSGGSNSGGIDDGKATSGPPPSDESSMGLSSPELTDRLSGMMSSAISGYNAQQQYKTPQFNAPQGYLSEQKLGGQWLQRYQTKGQVNNFGLANQPYHAITNPEGYHPKISDVLNVAQKRQQEASDTRPTIKQGYKELPYEKRAREQKLREEAQQNSELAQTMGSFTPSGSNPAAGAIGAETFANMNPLLTGPIMSTSRLYGAGRSMVDPNTYNPYFSSDKGVTGNIMGGLQLAGDVGMLHASTRTPQGSFNAEPNPNTRVEYSDFKNRNSRVKQAWEDSKKQQAGIPATAEQYRKFVQKQQLSNQAGDIIRNIGAEDPTQGGAYQAPKDKLTWKDPKTGETIYQLDASDYGNFKTPELYKEAQMDLRNFKRKDWQKLIDQRNANIGQAKQLGIFGKQSGYDPKMFSNKNLIGGKQFPGFDIPDYMENLGADMPMYFRDPYGSVHNVSGIEHPNQMIPYKGLKVTEGLSPNKFGGEQLFKQKKGGMITDPRGQWAHPGQNTRIPGGNITMQGVNYPVWAKASNGQERMMYPGQDYNFPGAKHVDEYPMLEEGGWLQQYQTKGQVTRTPIYTEDPKKVKAYQDSLSLYNRFKDAKSNYTNFISSQGFNPSYIEEWSTNGWVDQSIHPKIGAIKYGILDNFGGGMDRDIKGTPRYYNYYPTKSGKDQKLYEGSDLSNNIGKRYPIYKKPVQPYTLQPEPSLHPNVMNVQPIHSKDKMLQLYHNIIPSQHQDIELPNIQRGQYRTSYYDPQMKDWNEKAFMSQEESDQFANEMSQRGYPGSYGNVTQRKPVKGYDYKMGGGFDITTQTTTDPSVVKACDGKRDCHGELKSAVDQGPSKSERKADRAYDKETAREEARAARELAAQKAQEWSNYTNTGLDPYDTRYGRKDKTFSENYNKFITTNPNFAQEQSTLGLSPEQRYAMIYKMAGRSGSADFAAPQRLRSYMKLDPGSRFTDQQLYEATQRMGGIDKYADWWKNGYQPIQKFGGEQWLTKYQTKGQVAADVKKQGVWGAGTQLIRNMFPNDIATQYITSEPTVGKAAVNLVDPTGASNAPFLWESMGKMYEDPSFKHGMGLGMDIAASVPVFGEPVKVAAKSYKELIKGEKLGKQILKTAGRAGKNIIKTVEAPAILANQTLKKVGVTSPMFNNSFNLWNRGVHGYQTGLEGIRQGLNAISPGTQSFNDSGNATHPETLFHTPTFKKGGQNNNWLSKYK